MPRIRPSLPRALRAAATALALAVALAGPALAYTVILVDGSRLVVKEKYRVAGDRAILTLPNGTRTSLPLVQIDVAKTEAANEVDYGDVVVLDAPTERRPATAPAAPEPTLQDVAQRGGPRLGLRRQPTEAPQAEMGNVPRTAAGNPDLMRAARIPLANVQQGGRIAQMLRSRGVSDLALYEGTQPGRVLLEVTTNSEASVFQALQASAETLVELAEAGGTVPTLEIFMATDRRQRAGQFTMTEARARELTTRQLDTSEFFLAYVEF